MAAPSMHALAWVHLVALGWLSLTALSVLLFVLPQFTDVKWRGEPWARLGILIFALGAFALVIAFWMGGDSWLRAAAVTVVVGLVFYLVPAAVTLRFAMKAGSIEAAIARAFLIVLAFLGGAALIGLEMATRLASSTGSMPSWLPPVHADLAAIGWLTLLVMGVSARTIGPIAGRRSANRWVHIVASTLVTAGALGLALAGWTSLVLWPGIFHCSAGATLYAIDMLALLARSTVRHRPPQAFLAASMIWLVVAVALGVLVVAGQTALESAYVFVGLVGWVGQIVIAHLHHIGMRLIATMARGDDDETPPPVLLSPVLSWATFVLFQMAVATGLTALISDSSAVLMAASAAGFAAWIAMTANVARAVFKARTIVEA
jgi:hypothetical protein